MSKSPLGKQQAAKWNLYAGLGLNPLAKDSLHHPSGLAEQGCKDPSSMTATTTNGAGPSSGTCPAIDLNNPGLGTCGHQRGTCFPVGNNLVDLGLNYADICRALDRGANGKRLDDLSRSVWEAINQLTTCVELAVHGLSG